MSIMKTAFGDFELEEDQIIEQEGAATDPPADPPEGEGDEGDEGVDPPEQLENPNEDTPPAGDPPADPPEEEEGEDTLGFNEVVTELEKEGVFMLGEEEEFESSPEGMAAMMKANMAKFREKAEEEFKEKYGIDESPEIPQEYYSKLDPKVDKQAEEILRANLKSAGYTEEEVNETVADIVSRDKLTSEATKAKRIISEKEKQYISSAKEKAEAAKTARVEKREKVITDMKSDIDALDEVSGFKLDDERKAAFKDYLFGVGADGKTQAQRNATDNKRRIRLAWLDFMDANKEDFDIKATSKVMNKLKKKTTRFKPKAAVSGKSVDRREEEGKDKIDMSILDTFI